MSDMKKLHPDANLNAADLDGDGIVTEEELSKHERLLRIENDDQKEDAQRGMAWFALFGMLLYPFAVVLAGLAGLTDAPVILGDMAPTYFVSTAGLTAAFFGAQAWSKGK